MHCKLYMIDARAILVFALIYSSLLLMKLSFISQIVVIASVLLIGCSLDN